MNAVTIAILAYVALQLGVAFYVARRVRSEADYLVAGRSLGPVMAVFTVFATWFGAETCVGAAAKAFGNPAAGEPGGFTETTADPFGYTLCLLLMGLVFAVPLYRRKITTLADLVRQRYGARVEKLAALILVPSSILWAAAQIRAFGIVLGVSSTIDLDLMIVLAGAVVIVYTSVGGMWADAYADLIQGIVLVSGLVFVAIGVAISDGPGLSSITANQLAIIDPQRDWLVTLEGWAVPIFGSVVAQELVARVISSRSEQTAKRAILTAAGMYFLIGLIPPVIGLIAVHTLPGDANGEQALAMMANRVLPTALYVLFAGALVAAILSTVDSALLAAGGLLAHNVIVPMTPGTSERGRLWINRGAVVCFGVIACGLALSAEGVYELVETASSLGTSGILWIVIFSLWAPRFGGPAAAASALIAGVAIYVGSTQVLALEYPFLSSLAGSLLVYLGVAAIEPRSASSSAPT